MCRSSMHIKYRKVPFVETCTVFTDWSRVLWYNRLRWRSRMTTSLEYASDTPVASCIIQTTNMDRDNAHVEIGGAQSWLYPKFTSCYILHSLMEVSSIVRISRSWSMDHRSMIVGSLVGSNMSVEHSITNHPSCIIYSHPEESHGRHSWKNHHEWIEWWVSSTG